MTQRKNKISLASRMFELFGSMRFAISLLVVICIASTIGTVLQQNQADIRYIDMFGTYWYEVFRVFDVAEIYNTWWFLVIMAFLVVSTTICLIRNVPKMIKDMRSFREYVRISSLRAFPHKIDVLTDYTQSQAVEMAKVWLDKHGYAYKQADSDGAILLAAKKGSSTRLGYICAHLAIVVVCVGGLLDSELLNRMQIWLGHKEPIPVTARYVSDVPAASTFAVSNPSFRGNLSLSEGDSGANAMLVLGGNSYLQALPFDVKLNRFIIEYYETNSMPKRFASDITVTDHATGKSSNEIVEVNHPFTLHGVTLYQSSFSDGGSTVDLIGYPVKGSDTQTFEVKSKVGDSTSLKAQYQGQTLEYTLKIDDFRPINVENLGNTEGLSKPKSFEEQILAVTGSAAGRKEHVLRNVGPLVVYTLTDNRNQSVQYQNYMMPVLLENQLVYLLGMKLPGQEGFNYVRIPADEKGKLDEFMALRAAMSNPQLRQLAAQTYADRVQDPRIDKANIVMLAERALDIFVKGGFKGIDDYINGVDVPPEQRIPENLREPLKSILNDYLLFSAIELRNIEREKLGFKALSYITEEDARTQALWFESAMRAISDLSFYPAPVVLEMRSYRHIQASVLQTTRSPGKFLVYLGSLLLILGVFAMFYVRERRIWLWIQANPSHGSTIKAAMTSQKRTMDFTREFEQFHNDFGELERKS